MSDEERGNENEGTEPSGDAQGQQGADENEQQQISFDESQQAAIDRLIGERLKRARDRWEAEAQAAQEQEQAEAKAKRLEEQQEFQELAEQRKARVKELESRVSDLEPELKRHKEVLENHAAAMMDGLPDHVLALLAKMDVVERLDYLSEHGDKLRTSGKGGRGVPPTPGAKGDEELEDGDRRRRSAGLRSIW